MGYRQYTHCVQPQDYNYPLPATSNAIDVIAAIFDGLVLGGYFQDAQNACSYLLGGKLVCLGGDQCAIGNCTHFEPASDKSFPSNIDNDFSFNILLAPQSLGAFAFNSWAQNQAFAQAGPQGFLITEQPNMPFPQDPVDSSTRFHGYSTDYPDSHYISFDPSHSPFQVPGSDGPGFSVPTLHVECEGSRVHDVCTAIALFTLGPVGDAICHATFLGIPIGDVVCRVIALLAAPVLIPALLSAVTAAWVGATDGNQADARTDGRGGDLNFGDLVVVTGRWAFDAAHQGWNEFHPCKTIQKIDSESYDAANFQDYRNRWCTLTAVIPPYSPPGLKPTDMTPAQQAVYTNQQQPENQWIFHPTVDGCQPAEPPPR